MYLAGAIWGSLFTTLPLLYAVNALSGENVPLWVLGTIGAVGYVFWVGILCLAHDSPGDEMYPFIWPLVIGVATLFIFFFAILPLTMLAKWFFKLPEPIGHAPEVGGVLAVGRVITYLCLMFYSILAHYKRW